ncbi:MAG: trigger factor [Bacteroidaceae bacterium]|nr:trigger factor [Bacteroidaceae bacterium]
MNVSLQNIDKVSALLTVDMVKADYQENVEKQLKKIRKDAQMPGFRKGMVPMGLVKKMYEKSVIADEVNKLLGDAINKYIQDNKVHMLGEPLPNENQQQLDFDTQDEFKFPFDIALAPVINFTLSADDKVPYYDVTVTDEMVDNQVASYAQRGGSYEKVDSFDAAQNDMLKGLLCELDEADNVKEGGIRVESAVMMPSYMKVDDEKAKFAGAKVGDTVTFNPNKAWEGNAPELASLLKMDREEAVKVTSDFCYQVEEITRYMPGEMNQELFDQVFGKDVVKSEEEFKQKVREIIANQFKSNSDYKFLTDARKYIMDKVGKLEFSEPLMKRIMKTNNPDKDDKFVDENYNQTIDVLSWQLVRDVLVSQEGLKIEQNDIMEEAKAATRAQFAQYGMLNLPDDMIANYASEMLKKRETVENLADRVIDSKLADVLKKKVTLEHQAISAEDFGKMIQPEA